MPPIAPGHPLGCTEAELCAALLANMRERGVKYGVESILPASITCAFVKRFAKPFDRTTGDYDGGKNISRSKSFINSERGNRAGLIHKYPPFFEKIPL